jgi:HK97 family phage prohead protease
MQNDVSMIEIHGYACVFHEPDQQGDVILPGALGKPLSEILKTPVLWQHHPHTPIGKVVDAIEDTFGIRVRIALCLETQLGREAYQLVQSGVLTGLSIGYVALKAAHGTGRVRRILQRIRLKEVSLVTFPAHEKARILIDNQVR